MKGKCVRTLPPLRVPEKLEMALLRLAAHHERTVSEYMKRVLEHHCFGHGGSVWGDLDEDKENSAFHGDALRGGR